MDKLNPSQRSSLMSAVKSKDTTPEILVRRALHKLGYRFRLHRKDLPGKPDIALPKHNLCIFVHGCFWHQHLGCPRAKRPTTNIEFWNSKLDGNIVRDAHDVAKLHELGWRVCIIWECETKKHGKLAEAIDRCIGTSEEQNAIGEKDQQSGPGYKGGPCR